MCCVCAAELGQASGKGSTSERQPVFPKYYLELLGSTKSTLGLIGIKQVLTNHGSALISLWSSAVHYDGFQLQLWRNISKSFSEILIAILKRVLYYCSLKSRGNSGTLRSTVIQGLSSGGVAKKSFLFLFFEIICNS